MDNHTSVLIWPDGDPERWNMHHQSGYLAYIIFELPKLPNFAEPRFQDLGERLDERKSEVARRQMQMLRQLHSLGTNCASALRLRRDGNHLRLFTVVRLVSDQPVSPPALDKLATRIQHMFPKEYNLVRLSPDQDQERRRQALDLSWVRFTYELFKPEDTYRSYSWPYFYIASLWQPQSVNDMEHFCRTLVRFNGEAMLDLTLVPTKLGQNEGEWVDLCARRMWEAQSGERVYDEEGRLLKSFDPMPGLRPPLENYEDLLKRYKQNRLFLYAFRIFASEDPFGLAQALAASATHSKPQVVSLDQGHPHFQAEIQAGQTVDIAPEIHPAWWDESDERPLRAQRLHRLADLDEISGFWRFPMPVRAGFPGFELDTGLERRFERESERRAPQLISLGTLADDPAQARLAATFDREGLTKHGLIVGVPGSGKTTAMFSILYQLWSPSDELDRIPFIVLEPAKTEYRALKTIEPFTDDMLVFTLGDERISPFRFNPFEVPHGIPLESHVSRLNACFVGAFNLFDPLPLLLDKAIRQTYEAKGWFDDSLGGEPGLEAPTMADLCQQADKIIKTSGYSEKLRDDFNAALFQRLDSLRRGSKGRMLDTRQSIPFDLLMQRPVILELDALNEDEKALLMMFILTFVYEYAKANRRSGSPLRHVLIVEEAHNLIGRGDQSGSEFRANPKEQAIRLFVRMLAEMRALGQCILIADQLPTALAPEAMKQTNLKVLMRMTAMDDRVEIGNTMDLEESHLKDVTHFRSGQAYVFLEDWDRVRRTQTTSFKREHGLEEPPEDQTITDLMASFEDERPTLFMPFPECSIGCHRCNRRVRSQAERFVRPLATRGASHIENSVVEEDPQWGTVCRAIRLKAKAEAARLQETYGTAVPVFLFCAYLHLLHAAPAAFELCSSKLEDCDCKKLGRDNMFQAMLKAGQEVVTRTESGE